MFLVLWRGLSALEWLLHILGGLVGRSIVVYGILRLAFLGDAHNLVAVGIYPRGLRLTLFGIVLEIDGAVVAEFVFCLAYEDFLSGEVIGLLLLVERQLAPVFEPLDGAVGVVPRVSDLPLGCCALLLFLAVQIGVDEHDVSL